LPDYSRIIICVENGIMAYNGKLITIFGDKRYLVALGYVVNI
jgi:hypothetical protein